MVLGDQKIVVNFQKFAKLELARIYKHRKVNVYDGDKGRAIKDQPYDAIILAVDLASLRVTANPLNEIWDAERKAVEHFGKTVRR